MKVGVQFTGSVPANSTKRWFTHSWPAELYVGWNVVPTTPQPGQPQLEWTVDVERATSENVTYWISVRNLGSQAINVEARYVLYNEGA